MTANRGFKGTEVGIAKVNISGSMAEVHIQFVDEVTGQVHGIMKHNVQLVGEDDTIAKTANDFMTALKDYITQHHFTEPQIGKPIEEAARGISESLNREPDEPLSTQE